MKTLIAIAVLMLCNQVLNAEEAPGQPVAAEISASYQMMVLTNGRYLDQQGREVVDIIEGDKVYFGISLETKEGQPVMGAVPKVSIEGTTRMLTESSASPLTSTDESGIFEFGVLAGQKGLDKLTISYGENSDTLYLNVISLNFKTFPFLPELDGGLSWEELMKTQLDYVDGSLVASFPSSIVQQAGEQVDLVGYITPLEADTKQRHFLLTSAPPSCYFHIPGGATGVVEVFSEEGVGSSWNAVSLQGKLKLLESSTTGIIYQLHDARLIEE